MDFDQKNRQDWIDILKQIFPATQPKRCEWNELAAIVTVLNQIASKDDSNHMFYPTGGGMDIESAKPATEPGCVEIYTGLTDIIKPKCLIFESFPDPLWSYFRMETAALAPSGVYEISDGLSEDVTEIEPGRYISRSYWDNGEHHGEPLPKSARVLTRHLAGTFVIFAKSSPYNRHSRTYDGRHNNMSADEFRAYIEQVSTHGWKDR